MNISRIYAKFTLMADKVYRQAMLFASKHRVVRCHHLLKAAQETIRESQSTAAEDRHSTNMNQDNVFAEKLRHALKNGQSSFNEFTVQDLAGSVDSPMTNSPAMRRALELAFDRSEGNPITASHLVLMTLACWNEESPSGPFDEGYRRTIGELFHSLGLESLPAFQFKDMAINPPSTEAVGKTKACSPYDLDELIGPAITSDDMIDLYLTMKQETDYAKRAWLASRLEYLRTRG